MRGFISGCPFFVFLKNCFFSRARCCARALRSSSVDGMGSLSTAFLGGACGAGRGAGPAPASSAACGGGLLLTLTLAYPMRQRQRS